ncbi:putative heme d1 biosynthesis radical SAM protein NirJ1 [Pseudobacteroides cellulosolvens]|uniref:Mycofactocin maturase MftC n=1 Tax=Pseudobacteroides cellulosolvens ATCC 35603 = DSM 2933 TaxID=398512 RepID=A0A0L6JQT1_9FIRM|nr:putative heme d1 biosynthesis radical SAM protein NirJ1 [Pseudobacteroides cellulosolvens]KNY28060.1 putative heme d1 biosynthesis protein, NirJ1 [Pseudobacteroides cellulosolvens ATCC 35603 = DSM 2933]
MLGVTKLLCGTENYGDKLRYVPGAGKQKHGVSNGYGPVVAWNCTRTCNLKCMHCYSQSENKKYDGELTTDEAKKLIDDLSDFKVPVILISGGEPLVREDLLEIIRYTNTRSIRCTISTNGTLIDREHAKKFKQLGVGYIGISLDGIGRSHDAFRGVSGSFDNALKGIRNCIEAEQKVGLRFTISKYNYKYLDDIFYLIKEEKIPRVCFYHLVYSGRGTDMVNDDITHDETRSALDLIMNKAIELGSSTEILTVDNHSDAVYLYLQSLKKYPLLSDKILSQLKMNGGNRSGIAFGNIDSEGYVHPDQFTQQHILGNVKERTFSEIWKDESNDLMSGLKERKPLLKGRCSLCKWIDICNGNFRARAEAVTGDFWASDPACYLNDEEIGI